VVFLTLTAIDMRQLALSIIALAMVNNGCSQTPKTIERTVGGNCEDCELMFVDMPKEIFWQTQIADKDEPGEPLIISGVIYQKDGKTPAPGVILYVYHTNNEGIYAPANSSKQMPHGKLRGWVKTDENGSYQFKTIKPASYPGGRAPKHIHPIIKEPNTSAYWIDEFLFENDPFVDQKVKDSQRLRGGYGIIEIQKNSEGIWIGKRDIILGLNVPNY